MTRIRKLPQSVFPIRRMHHVEVSQLRIPLAKPLVMLGSEADVFHPRRLGQVEPRLRVIVFWIPLAKVSLLEVSAWHTAAPLQLLMPSLDRIEAPMHEHPKPLLEPPVARVSESWNQCAVAARRRCLSNSAR